VGGGILPGRETFVKVAADLGLIRLGGSLPFCWATGRGQDKNISLEEGSSQSQAEDSFCIGEWDLPSGGGRDEQILREERRGLYSLGSKSKNLPQSGPLSRKEWG